MKTLDEVITVLDGCFLKSRKEWCIENCPYLQNDEQMCRRDVLNDALHYLKTYRANQRTYEENSRKAEEARERYIEAVKNCELAENKYRKLTEETSQKLRNTSQITCPKCHSEFLILPEANNPLTWDELRTMEGKPVWLEHPKTGEAHWAIIGNWYDESEMRLFLAEDENAYYVSRELYDEGILQAYRKERS